MAFRMNLTRKELQEQLKFCSSIKDIRRTHYGEVIIYKESAILDQSGKPVPLKTFLELTGQRKLRETYDFSKTPEEKIELKRAKKRYEDDMRHFLGADWRKLSNKLRCFNVPENTNRKNEIIRQINSK